MIDPKVLLPCPFCGGGVEIDKVDEEHCRNVKIYSAVHCAECGQWFFKGMSEEKAIAAWNRRAVHPHLAQRVLKLEGEVDLYWMNKAQEIEDENAKLRADNAALWEVTAESFQAFSVALEEARGEDWPEIRKLRDKCQQALSILHPGDSLLKELAALRTVREAAQAIISQIDTECDGECQDIAYMKLELTLRNALAAVTGGTE